MWSSRLFWKLLLAYSGLYVLLGVLYVAIVAGQQRELLTEQLKSRLRNEAVLLSTPVSRLLVEERYDELQTLVSSLGRQTNTRLTVIGPDGTVLADSEEQPQRMRNHADRPELVEAAERGMGEADRLSTTLGKRMQYYAIPVTDEGRSLGFLRLALDRESVDREVASLNRKLILLILAVAVVAVILSYVVMGRIIQPLSQLTESAKAIAAGDYSKRVPVVGKDELGELAAAFNAMQEQLSMRVDQLQENSGRMLTVLGGMAEGVIAVDHNQRLLLANATGLSMLDITASDVVGRPLLELVRNRDVQQTVLDAMHSREAVAREITMSTAQRRVLRLLATCLPGTPCPGVVVVLHDVTDLRRLESLRREFVANVSHELKTPLSAIKAYAETLRIGAINDSENNMRFVERIEEEASRLHQLIVDLLHLARVETGKEAFQFSSVSIAEAIETCRQRHADTAASAGLVLSCDAAMDGLFVWADASGLQMILDNLLSNAIKYTPRGGQVVLRSRPAGEFALVEVQDTGIGIAPQHHHRIFERFYRVDRARSRDLGGTGLGLAIVKHLAQAFGGDVGLESEPGRGSIFRVRLPRADEQA